MTERCIDASVIVKVLVAEDLSDIAAVIVKETEVEGLIIIAPFLLEAEVASTLSKKVKDGLITVDEAQAALTIFQSIPVTFQHFPSIAPRALELATRYNWRYAYDGFYIALAEHCGCELWTADEKLVKDVSVDLPFVKWLGDYQPKAHAYQL
jgi:predicted nucleic acid-binding protein